jgi:two-component system chemotaxis response regulator CheY
MKLSWKVLSVDDSAAMLSIITTYLRGSEFEVVATARDGKQAVGLFKDVQPDMILLDLVMPGQSGQETLCQILDLEPNAFVVIVSSLGTEESVEECMSLGARGFLRKPFSRDDLLSYLRELAPSS